MPKGQSRNRKARKVSKEATTTISISVKYLIAIIVALGFIAALFAYAKARYSNSPIFATPTPIILPTVFPTTTPVEIATTKPKPVVNTDPITDCVSSYPNCNGESIRLKQSQCSNITCCQVGGNWSVYPNVEKCKTAQSNVQPQNTIQNNINNAKSNSYNICANAVQATFNICQSTCNTNADTGRLICNSLPYGDQFTACLNDDMNTFNTCDDKCLSDSNDGVHKCLSVWNQ